MPNEQEPKTYRPSQINTRRPDSEFIAKCEELLADAKRGELVGFAGVLIYHEGMTDFSWWDKVKPHWDNSILADRVIGSLDRLKFLLLCNRHGVDADDTWGTN